MIFQKKNLKKVLWVRGKAVPLHPLSPRERGRKVERGWRSSLKA